LTNQIVSVRLNGDKTKRTVEAAFCQRVLGEETEKKQIGERDKLGRFVSAAVPMKELIVRKIMNQIEARNIDEHIQVVVRTLRCDATNLKSVHVDLHAIVGCSDELIEQNGVLRIVIREIGT
jgi:hypothetical protein